MPADLPPPAIEPPALTAQQENDLACLRAGVFLRVLAKGSGGADPLGDRLIRLYLPRLQRSEGPDHDWIALAQPATDMPYGEFMTLMERCVPRRRLR